MRNYKKVHLGRVRKGLPEESSERKSDSPRATQLGHGRSVKGQEGRILDSRLPGAAASQEQRVDLQDHEGKDPCCPMHQVQSWDRQEGLLGCLGSSQGPSP